LSLVGPYVTTVPGMVAFWATEPPKYTVRAGFLESADKYMMVVLNCTGVYLSTKLG